MENHGMWQRAWVEIDLDALADNFRSLKKTLSEKTKLCCVVKANAYGHGALAVSALYERLGADFLAVSNLEEALELRLGGITLPILILGYTVPDCAALLSKYKISQCVFSLDYAKALSEAAVRAGVSVKIHVKLDSGMGRIGFSVLHPEERAKTLSELLLTLSLPALLHEGIFTHFAMSDMGEAGSAFTRRQFAFFEETLEALKARGYTFSIRHVSNSAAIADYPEYELDMVRAGIVLYGYHPSKALKRKLPLRPALSLCGIVDMVKEIKAGDSVSYGATFVAERPTRVATVPIGYADGLFRHIDRASPAFSLCGKKISLLGRICMDQCMLDVSEIPEVSVGKTVAFYGKSGEDIASLAERLGTIPYELITALDERLARVYRENGETVLIKNRILPDGYPIV